MSKLIYSVFDDAFHAVTISAPNHCQMRRYFTELGHCRVEKCRMIGDIYSYNFNSCSLLMFTETIREKFF